MRVTGPVLRNNGATERYCCAMKKIAEVLEGLREEQRRLQMELAGVERAIGALEEVLGGARTQASASVGLYAMTSVYDAVVAYLSAAGEPKTAREIAEALQAGGHRTRSANFAATVRTMLSRNGMSYGISPTETGGRWFIRG